MHVYTRTSSQHTERTHADRTASRRSCIWCGHQRFVIPWLCIKCTSSRHIVSCDLSPVRSYTASTTQVSVTFINEDTQEYTYYELKFIASPPARQPSVTLEGPVRTLTTARVSIHNPLATPVTVKASASHKLVKVPPTTTLAPGTTTHIPLSFRPLLVASEDAVLQIDGGEVGPYEWPLKLAGLSTNPDKALMFTVPLGGRDTQVYRFTHWLEDKADYKVGRSALH